MTINPNTDRGTTGRWKYGWVPPTPEQFCEMIQDTGILPDNGTVALPGTTKVLGMNPGECPEIMDLPQDIYVTSLGNSYWDDATNTMHFVIDLSNGTQVQIPILWEDVIGNWAVIMNFMGDTGTLVSLHNGSQLKLTSPLGTLAISTDDVTGEARFDVDMCKVAENMPLGTYDSKAKIMQFKSTGPAGFTGFEFDYPNDFGTTDASDTFMHLVYDSVNGVPHFMPPATNNPTTPVPFSDVTSIQDAIDQTLVAGGFNAGDIVWQVISPTQVVVWYNLSAGALTTIYSNMFWAGTNTPDDYTNKTIPQVPTSIIPGVGCPELVDFSLCDEIKDLPTGTFNPDADFIQIGQAVGLPSGAVGFDIDNNELTCSGGLPSTSEIGDFQVNGCGSVTPLSPIPMTDVVAMNSFINSDLIPAINACLGASYVPGDILYQYNATSDIVTVWYHPGMDPSISEVHNFVVGPLSSNNLCVKVVPTIPTSTTPPASGLGCPELVKIPKNRFRTYQPLVVGSNLIAHNLGYSEVMVEVRNDTTGELVACRVINETTTSCELELSMAVATARITVR